MTSRRDGRAPSRSRLIQIRRFKKALMTTTLNYLKDEQQASDRVREAQRRRRRRKVRRVAVIRPAGSHFKLLPARGKLDGTAGRGWAAHRRHPSLTR